MNKILIEMISDSQYREYTKGDLGYVAGFVRGGDDVPYVACVIGESIILAPLRHVKVRIPVYNEHTNP